MSKRSYLLLLIALAFVFVVPAYASQNKNQNASAEVSSGKSAVETTSEYVNGQVEGMGLMNAEDKTKAVEAVLEKVRERVEAMIQNAVRRYEQVQTQVKKAEGLTEAEKASIGTKVATQIEAMNALKVQVQAADTVDELKTVMAQVKTRFKLSLGLTRQAVSGVFEDRLAVVLTKLTDVYGRLVVKVDALAEGEEKTELLATLAEAQVLLVEAQGNIDLGEFVAAKDNLVNARENLQEVAEGLK